MKLMAMALLAAMSAAPAWAVNKCTDSTGKVVFQDAPCGNTAKAEAVKIYGGNTTAATPVPGKSREPNLKLAAPAQAGALMGYYREWADNEKLLHSTARISLAGPVGTMQKLQRTVEGYQAPECLAVAKSALVALIASNVESTIQFMQKNDLSNMAYMWVNRPKAIQAFESAVSDAVCK